MLNYSAATSQIFVDTISMEVRSDILSLRRLTMSLWAVMMITSVKMMVLIIMRTMKSVMMTMVKMKAIIINMLTITNDDTGGGDDSEF